MRRGNEITPAMQNFVREIETESTNSFPKLDGKSLTAFRHREFVHGRFPFREFTDFTGSVLELSLQHALDREDPAYSDHGAEHQVYGEAVANVLRALKTETATAEFSDRAYGRTIARRLVLRSPEYLRTGYRPAFLEVGIQMAAWKKNLTNPHTLEPTLKKLIVQLARRFGTAAAAATLLAGEITPPEVCRLLTDSQATPTFTTRRQADWTVVHEAYDQLFPKKFITHQVKKHAAAAQLLSGYKPWGSADQDFFLSREIETPAQSLVVFNSFGEQLTLLGERKGLFRNLQDLLEEVVSKYDGLFTTEVGTAYNKYPIHRPLNFVDGKTIDNYIDKILR